MALPTFNPGKPPTLGTEVTKEPQLRAASFGDGYTMSQPKGINNIKETLPLSWELVPPDTGTYVDTFLTERNGKPFYFQPFYSAVPLKWTCKQWKIKSAEGGVAIAAQFDRYFGVEI